MAIVQVSRITQRQGLQEDLPSPLAGAEFGWAVDQRRLFIGNGALADGAPVVGNTEILTEFSDLLEYSTAYTYQGEAAGYIVQTGTTSGDPVSQSLQSRLDSYAIITDFGATGDGSTDVTAAINLALQQLYCVQSNTQVRRSLFFPAGTYIISDTIDIPSYAKIYGEGANSTIISFVAQPWVANTAYDTGVLVLYTATSTYYRSIAPVPPSGILISNTSYWIATTLPDFVFQTADSLQQTGADIGNGGATPPTNIEVSDIAFKTSSYGTSTTGNHSIGLVEKANQCSFNEVSFIGPLTTTELVLATEDLSGLKFSSTASLTCKDITLNDCKFTGTTYGINTAQALNGITASNSWFDTLYQGVVLGDTVVVDGGPAGVRLMHNMFDNIYAEGVVITNCSLNATAYNTFYDVGNHFNGTTSPATSIITIDADNNISLGDLFQRTTAQADASPGYPRIKIYNGISQTIPSSIGLTNATQFQLGSYSRNSGQQTTLTDAASNTTLFTVDTSIVTANNGFKAFNIDYTIYRYTAGDTSVRTGKLQVVGSTNGGSSVVYTDDYSENTSTGITLAATETSNVITVNYSATSTGYGGLIYYSINRLA